MKENVDILRKLVAFSEPLLVQLLESMEQFEEEGHHQSINNAYMKGETKKRGKGRNLFSVPVKNKSTITSSTTTNALSFTSKEEILQFSKDSDINLTLRNLLGV